MYGVLHRFQHDFSLIIATAHIIHVFPGFHMYKAGALKCLDQGHSHKKPRGTSVAQTQGPLDYESNTLPLGHVGPLLQIIVSNVRSEC